MRTILPDLSLKLTLAPLSISSLAMDTLPLTVTSRIRGDHPDLSSGSSTYRKGTWTRGLGTAGPPAGWRGRALVGLDVDCQ